VRRGNYPLLRLAMVGAAALISAGCSTTLELPRGPLMGFPAPAGVQQIRDAAGRAVYEPFNPCAGPTAKTPVLGGYQSLDEARARPAPAAPKIIALGTLHLTRPMPTAAAPPFAAPIAQPLTLAVPLPALPVSASPAVTTLFAFSSARLTPQAKAAIRDFASRAKSAPAVYARGFTDAQGSAVANEVLARNRAAVVRAELIAHGVPPDKIKTSYCTTCFCSDNGTAAGRQANRRVDIGLDRPTT
jgi:outer membrane protein OmpA-like peptidoglycan-associated protein